MKKQKRVLKAIIVLIMLIALLMPIISFATNEEGRTIEICTNTNTNIINLGENVNVTVNWSSSFDVQAIGFTLQYDKDKLEFVDATFKDKSDSNEQTLEETYYNIETPGTVILSKISLNDLGISSINFNFKTNSIGKAVVQLSNIDCVSDGSLVSPDVIDFTTNGLTTIEIAVFGDVNLDGEINTEDSIYLARYLEGTEGYELNEKATINADVNLDGIVDEIDFDLLFKYVSGHNIIFPIKYGDVNLDGKITSRDIIMLRQYLDGSYGVELSEQAKICADVNLDGLLNDIDVTVITRWISAGMQNTEYNKMPFKMIKNENIKAKDIGNIHIVSGFDLEKAKVSELLENFDTTYEYRVRNIAGETLENDAVFGTGTKIEMGGNWGTENYAAEYNVVIYGDTTGDGKINAIDALALIKHLNGAIPFESEIFTEAGRIVCEDGAQPTAVDALAIIKHANKKQLISQTK